jgi:hypothetical protein
MLPRFLLLASFSLSACGPSDPAGDAGSVNDAGPRADAFPRVDATPADAALPSADAGPASGSYAYYFGDFDVEDVYQVARVDLGNRVRSILPIAGLEGGGDITGLAISPDNGSIVVAGQNSPTSAPVLRLYPADGSGAGLELFAAADSDRLISALQFSPDGNWVAFLTDSEIVGSKALHLVPVDASAAAKRVSLPPVGASQDVQSFRWAGDSVHIAFVGDLVTNNDDALWTVNATVISPTITEIVTTAELGGRDVGRLVAFDSSDRLYFVADFELADNQSRLYRSAIDGTGREQVAGTALTNGGGEASVGGFSMSPDGSHIAFASDSPTANLSQVFTLDLATTAPALVSNITTTPPPSSERGPNFFEPMRWSPDGSKLTMAADWPIGEDANNDFGAFVLPTSGSPGGVGLAEATIGNGDVFAPAFSADSAQIVFRGDLLVSNHSDLYLADDLTTSNQDPAGLLLEESVVGGTVKGFVVSH